MGKTDRPTVQLSGMDGNAFMIIGRCRKVASQTGWSPEKIKEITDG